MDVPLHEVAKIHAPCSVQCLESIFLLERTCNLVFPFWSVLHVKIPWIQVVFVDSHWQQIKSTSMYYYTASNSDSEIDIVEFTFTRCVVYSFSEYFFVVSFNYKKYQWLPLWKRLPGAGVIYLIKVNYASYNYTSHKSTWTPPLIWHFLR